MKTVIHYRAGPYLLITETWIYEQIRFSGDSLNQEAVSFIYKHFLNVPGDS